MNTLSMTLSIMQNVRGSLEEAYPRIIYTYNDIEMHTFNALYLTNLERFLCLYERVYL